jgi:RNA polymerase sigma-70 factor (ECF subfamily)
MADPFPRGRAAVGLSREQELVARFTTAFEEGDVEGVVALLTDGALLTMPP